MDKVILTADTLGETREFKLSHAQKLFDYQTKFKTSDWKLDDKRYTVEDGIIKPVGNTKKSKALESNSGSSQPAEEA